MKNSLLLTVNYGKRCTFPIMRDVRCCQGATSGPSVGMLLCLAHSITCFTTVRICYLVSFLSWTPISVIGVWLVGKDWKQTPWRHWTMSSTFINCSKLNNEHWLGKPMHSSRGINKHVCLITTTKSWRPVSGSNFQSMFHHRFANATQINLKM